jgi:hypothetical protein
MADSSFYEALFYLILGIILDRTFGRVIDWLVRRVMVEFRRRVDNPTHLLWKLAVQPPVNIAGVLLFCFAVFWMVFPIWYLAAKGVTFPIVALVLTFVVWWFIGWGMLRLSVMLLKFRVRKRQTLPVWRHLT